MRFDSCLSGCLVLFFLFLFFLSGISDVWAVDGAQITVMSVNAGEIKVRLDTEPIVSLPDRKYRTLPISDNWSDTRALVNMTDRAYARIMNGGQIKYTSPDINTSLTMIRSGPLIRNTTFGLNYSGNYTRILRHPEIIHYPAPKSIVVASLPSTDMPVIRVGPGVPVNKTKLANRDKLLQSTESRHESVVSQEEIENVQYVEGNGIDSSKSASHIIPFRGIPVKKLKSADNMKSPDESGEVFTHKSFLSGLSTHVEETVVKTTLLKAKIYDVTLSLTRPISMFFGGVFR